MPPRPPTKPITLQRRVSAGGVITAGRQRVALGRVHAGCSVTVRVSEHTLAVELDDETRTIGRIDALLQAARAELECRESAAGSS